MNSRVKQLLLAVMLVVGVASSAGLLIVSAHRQQNAVVVLHNPEQIFADVTNVENIFGATQGGGFTVYAVNAAESSVFSYNAESKVMRPAELPQEMESLTSLRLKNGDIVTIASPDDDALLSLLSPSRQPVKKFGKKKEFGIGDKKQNLFFNQGRVVADPQNGVIYFVPTHSPTPVVQKYSSQGELLSEFAVEGEAIELQVGLTRKLFENKKGDCAEGYTVITSAAVDPTTGHLWLGMNGSSKSGVVYEYSVKGKKLREYAFFLNGYAGAYKAITGVKGIAVRAPHVFVLSVEGAVYRYNRGSDLSASLSATYKAKERAERRDAPYLSRVGGFINSFWSSPPSPRALLQSTCPPEQALNCVANCRPGASPTTSNCGSRAKSSLPSNTIVTGQTGCNNSGTVQGRPCMPTCIVSFSACRDNGDTFTTTYTSACNPPREICNNGVDEDCTGTADDGCTVGGVWCDLECFEPNPDCPCYDMWGRKNQPHDKTPRFVKAGYRTKPAPLCNCSSSPILIDVLGNGYSMTNPADGVKFDFNGDGVAKGLLSWTAAGSDDAWLALDLNGNGTIDSGKELFGNATTQLTPPEGTERHGFRALAQYDKASREGNGDGVIDNKDAIYSSLRLWQDSNHNGISEPEELHTLTSLDVASIDLDYKESRRTDEHGNQFKYRGKVRDAKGAKVNRWAWDVFLVPAP